MSTTVKYNGSTIATLTNQTKILNTHDKWLTQDIEIKDETLGIGAISQDANGYIIFDNDANTIYKEDDWERPEEWMPYAIGWNDNDFEGLYWVYDLSLNKTQSFWSLLAVAIDGYTLDFGYVNSEGVFNISSSQNYTSNTTASGLLPIWDGNVLSERFYVIRMTANNPITTVRTSQPSASIFESLYGSGVATIVNMTYTQSLIEVYGSLPNVSILTSAFRCYNLVHAHLLNLNSLTNLSNAFYADRNLKRIDGMQSWNTSKVTSMTSLFGYCRSLLDVSDIYNWNVEKVTDLSSMFTNSNIRYLNLGNWTVTTSLTNISKFCEQARALKELILPKGNYSKVAANSITIGCEALNEIIFPDSFSSSNFDSSFYSLCAKRDIDFSKIDLSRATNLTSMFNSCQILEVIDFKDKDTSKVTNMTNFSRDCYNLREIDFTNCDFSKVTNTNQDMFVNCYSLTRLKGYVYYQSFKLSNSNLMPVTSLVEVLTNLPTVSSAKTITLGTTNSSKLSAEQIAIATEKGWTVA